MKIKANSCTPEEHIWSFPFVQTEDSGTYGNLVYIAGMVDDGIILFFKLKKDFPLSNWRHLAILHSKKSKGFPKDGKMGPSFPEWTTQTSLSPKW